MSLAHDLSIFKRKNNHYFHWFVAVALDKGIYFYFDSASKYCNVTLVRT